jgi:hypothetical protein
MAERPPTFDAARFGAWLTRQMDAWDVSVNELAERSGVHRTSITMLRSGRSHSGANAEKSPSINLIARVAWGLRMPLDFVAAQAGLTWDGPIDRWDLLVTDHERGVLARKLGGDAADLDALLRAEIESASEKETV